ncbi:MAG: hypothetical protein IT308_09930 [Anaerolineaceae bacterium]|nr:hypothetical protein [Anaerolineaceae bacterium]
MDDNKFLKQNLARAYTHICQDIFRVGVKRINIDIKPGYILIVVEQPRSPIFINLHSEGYENQAHELGLLMGRIFKKRFLKVCKDELGLSVRRIFRDYNDGVIITYLQLD